MTDSTWVSATNSDRQAEDRLPSTTRGRQQRLRVLLLLAGLVWSAVSLAADDAVERFVSEAFNGEAPAPKALWLTGERKQMATRIMGHDYPALRLRYWLAEATSVWVLEEIGKTEPITAGFVVGPEGLSRVEVLVYRESRGGEVQYPFFTDQFRGATLTADQRLDRPIDGITGATLSVRAMTRLGRLALYLHQQVATKDTVIALQ